MDWKDWQESEHGPGEMGKREGESTYGTGENSKRDKSAHSLDEIGKRERACIWIGRDQREHMDWERSTRVSVYGSGEISKRVRGCTWIRGGQQWRERVDWKDWQECAHEL